MALFDEALVRDVTARVRRRYTALGAALGVSWAVEPPASSADTPSPLRDDLRLLIRVANGEVYRLDATPQTIREIERALARLLDLLLGNALSDTLDGAPGDTPGDAAGNGRQPHPLIPEDFWRTEIGVLVSRVRWWLSADELITISNAAALAFGENTQANRMRIARAMENGQLEWVIDPSVANPQQNRRVLRPQVERLRETRRLPD